jgi:hypothetical protein
VWTRNLSNKRHEGRKEQQEGIPETRCHVRRYDDTNQTIKNRRSSETYSPGAQKLLLTALDMSLRNP